MEKNYKANIRQGSNKPIIIFFTSNDIGEVNENNPPNNKYNYINITKTRFFQKKQYDTIFIRDIKRAWYLYGINETCNSIEKVLELLKEKCKGRKIIVVGGSAGGFAAIYFGLLLKAERIIVFDPQVDLPLWFSFYEGTNTYAYLPNDFNERIPNIFEIIKSHNSKIYYFFASQSKIDLCQYNTIKEFKNFICFPTNSNEHARTIMAENMLDLIFFSEHKLNKLSKNTPKNGYSRIGFLFKSVNIFRAFAIITRKLIRIIKKRLASKKQKIEC